MGGIWDLCGRLITAAPPLEEEIIEFFIRQRAHTRYSSYKYRVDGEPYKYAENKRVSLFLFLTPYYKWDMWALTLLISGVLGPFCWKTHQCFRVLT